MLKDAVGTQPGNRPLGRALSTSYAHVVVTVAFLDTMVQLPLLSPFAASLGAGAATAGFILGAYSLVNMIGNVVAGPVIDRAGRRRTIAGGMLIAGAALAAYALVRTPGQLLLLRLAHGAGGAVLIPAVFAWMGDRSRDGSVGRSMGYAGAAVAIAAMIGPAIGGFGRDLLGVRAVFLGVGALLCVTAISALFFVRDAAAPQPPAERTRKAAVHAVLAALGDRHLRYAYWSVFGLTFAMGVLAYTFPLTMDRAGFSAGRTGAFFSVFSAAAILVLILPTNRLSDRFGRRPLIIAGSLAVAIALAFLPVAHTAAAIAATMALYGVGYGTLFPSACATVVDATSAANRGTAFGLFYAAFSLGVTTGLIAAGLAAGLAAAAGITAYWLAAALLIAIRLGLLAAGRRRSRQRA